MEQTPEKPPTSTLVAKLILKSRHALGGEGVGD